MSVRQECKILAIIGSEGREENHSFFFLIWERKRCSLYPKAGVEINDSPELLTLR